MESEYGSNQTVWQLVYTEVREAWGNTPLYKSNICMGITVERWYKYVDRFQRLPSKALRIDMALEAIEFQKAHRTFCKYVHLGMQHQCRVEDARNWALNQKVSDFDN